jgi:hypothetical protein
MRERRHKKFGMATAWPNLRPSPVNIPTYGISFSLDGYQFQRCGKQSMHNLSLLWHWGDVINFSKENHSSVAGIWHDEVKGKIVVNLFDLARRNYMREVWLALDFADQFGRLWPSQTSSTMSRRTEGQDY